jgi:hypothetical protein
MYVTVFLTLSGFRSWFRCNLQKIPRACQDRNLAASRVRAGQRRACGPGRNDAVIRVYDEAGNLIETHEMPI